MSVKLTPEELASICELQADRKATERTLEIALDLHANRLGQIEERVSRWWRELTISRDLPVGHHSINFNEATVETTPQDETSA